MYIEIAIYCIKYGSYLFHPLEKAQNTVINPLISITLTSPHSLKSEVHISARQEKHLFFSEFPHHQKFVPNIKNKQNETPQQIKMPLD